MARQYSNTSRSMRLLADVTAVTPTILVDDATGLPVTFPYNLVIDPDTSLVEVVAVTASSGNTLTVSRGQQDTPASAHATSAVVYHAWTALDGQEAQSHFDAAAAVHGVGATANVVGTDTTQVLTNKSISGAANTLTNLPAEQVSGTHKNVIAEGSTAANVAIIAQAVAGQSADVQQWKDEGGGLITRVNSDGELVLGSNVRTGGSTNIDGDTTVTGDIDVTGNAAIAGSTIATGVVEVTRAGATDNAFRSKVNGEAQSRFIATADGKLNWGGGVSGTDTNLYRTAASVLRTDDSLEIAGDLDVRHIETTGDITVGSDGAGNLQVNGTVGSTGDMTVGSDGFANLQVNGALGTTGDVTVGSDGVGNLVVNGTADINGAADISGALNVGGAFTAGNMVCGTVSMNPVANTPTQERVNFGVTLTAPIRVWVTAQSGFIGSNVIGVGVTDLTTTGFDCVIYRTNTTATNVFWLAIGGAV